MTSENFSFDRQELRFSELAGGRRKPRGPADGLKTLDMQGDLNCRSQQQHADPEIRRRAATSYTLDFYRRYPGVGLAFVRMRGYGRRRWLVT